MNEMIEFVTHPDFDGWMWDEIKKELLYHFQPSEAELKIVYKAWRDDLH